MIHNNDKSLDFLNQADAYDQGQQPTKKRCFCWRHISRTYYYIHRVKWRHSILWSQHKTPCCRAWCRTMRSLLVKICHVI